MEKTDSIDEILEFAIAREVEANQLYLYMARWMENPEMSKVCEALAKEELEHKEKLELEVIKRGRVVSDINISDYIMDVGSKLDMDYQEMLLYAINKEGISVKLYKDLAEVVKDKDSRQTLLTLAKEETEHKQRFEKEYDKLLKQK
ncbi:MAG: ferritin-like domain-containing protein [Planctomycetota bacterium]|nr:MAG: ferritin-like domain-containing protein [Planctomycetota bacterium]